MDRHERAGRERLSRQERRADMEIVLHGLQAWVMTEKDRIDSHALRTVLTVALKDECGLYDDGREIADGSEVKLELLLLRVQQLSHGNTARVARRFRL
jgi:hypothetical protein